jgi:hypothetical protein
MVKNTQVHTKGGDSRANLPRLEPSATARGCGAATRGAVEQLSGLPLGRPASLISRN